MRKQTVNVIKWIVLFVALILLFVLQTTVSVFAIFGVRPILIVPFVLALSMQERENYALVFGLVAGFLWDFSSGKIPGFNAAILMIGCVAVSLLTNYYLGNNVLNAVWICAVVMLAQGLLDYVFYYLIWRYPGNHLILVKHILPTALYTTVLSVPFFFLMRWGHGVFNRMADR